MNRFRKINVLVNIELIAIFCVVFVSFAIAMLPFIFTNNIILEMLIFIIILVLLSPSLGFMTKKFFDSIFRKLEYKSAISKINVKVGDNIKIKNFKTDKSKIYYINRYHLSTVSFLLLSDLKLNYCKKIRSENNDFIKKKFKKARKTNPPFSHWIYQINVFVVDDDLLHDNLNELVNRLNNNQLYEIGKLNVIYIKNTSYLLIKNFETKNISLIDFLRYKKMIRLLSKFTDLSYKEIINNL